MASQLFSKRERARDAGQGPSETRQMAEQEQLGERSSGSVAIVIVLLGVILVIALYLATR